MTAERGRFYRFGTDAQWDTCLFAQADRDARDPDARVRPFAPYALPGTAFAAPGARAPLATRVGEVLWCGDGDVLYRLPAGEDVPVSVLAPYAIAHASRLIATSGGLWAIGSAPGTLECFDAETLARRLVVAIPQGSIVDIAVDGQDGVYALAGRDGIWQCVWINCAGNLLEAIMLDGLVNPIALVFLRLSQQLVVLAGNGSWLRWYSLEGSAATFKLFTPAMAPCFSAAHLGSDSRARLFLAGVDGNKVGGHDHVMVLDSDGNVVGDLPLDAPATGVATARDSALITTGRGLAKFSVSDIVPEAGSEIHATLVTPVLHSPDTADRRRWLRVEAFAKLPPGTTLEVSYAATDDPLVRDRMVALAADTSRSESDRLQKLCAEPGVWRPPMSFAGSEALNSKPDVPVAAPLFDVHEPYLWIGINLIAPAGTALPALAKLDVLYPGRSLMEHLPAQYQNAEVEPGSFIRSLVGVLETTTQSLDARIASMGSQINPATAPIAWLDFVARWLGLPWDDALDDDQKRRIIGRAADIAKGRGTRAGLEALLGALLPGTPRRYRIVDASVDFGIAMIGGGACCGSPLPTLLGGLPLSGAELGMKAVLGYLRLPCAGHVDDGVGQIAGRLRVDVAASAREWREWEPWLYALISEMVPVTTRLALYWTSTASLQANVLGDTLTLQDMPAAPYLGTDAVTGQTRLPDRGATLSATGTDSNIRLH